MPNKDILLIEDEPCILDIYNTVLKKAGFSVRVANNGEEAQEEFKSIKEGKSKEPDLVLLDLILPDVNGIDILKKVRKQKGISDIPFFILTNYTDPKLEKEGKKLKVSKYLLKTDLTPSQLIDSIEKWLKRKKK
jgi:DNA-binding response OmpR family regulator